MIRIIILMLLSGLCHPATMSFDELDIERSINKGVYINSGYRISGISNIVDESYSQYHGSQAVAGSSFQLTRDFSTPFSLYSLELATIGWKRAYIDIIAYSIDVAGYVSKNDILINQDTGKTIIKLDNFTNIISVTIATELDGYNGFFQLDNIHLSPTEIPAPPAIYLFALSILSLGFNKSLKLIQSRQPINNYI